MLTYDTTLQVVARTAQHDLFLDWRRLLGSHFLLLFAAGVRPVKDEGREGESRGSSKRSEGGGSSSSSDSSSGGSGSKSDGGMKKKRGNRSRTSCWAEEEGHPLRREGRANGGK